MARSINNMNLKIFSDWAQYAQDGQIAGMKGSRLGDINEVSKSRRKPKMESVAAMRNAAIDSFKRALTEKYGLTLAHNAWTAVGGNISTKGLSAELIKATIKEADSMVADLNELLKPRNVTVSDIIKKADPETNILSEEGKKTFQLYKFAVKDMALRKRTDALLCMTPSTRAEADLFKQQVFNAMCSLRIHSSDADKVLSDEPEMKAEIKDEARQCVEALDAKLKTVAAYMDDLPGGEKALDRLADHWTAALNKACGQLLDSYRNVVPGERSFSKLERKINALTARYGDKDTMLALLKDQKKKTGAKLQSAIAKCVSSVYRFGVPRGVIKVPGLLDQCHLDLLNGKEKSWKVIDKLIDVQLEMGGKKLSLNSIIRPGLNIDKSIKDQYKGMRGFNCHTKNTANAVNLATTELKIKVKDGFKTVFRGVRHAAHNAKNVENMTNKQANLNRAKQTVTAAFVEYLKMHPGLVGSKQSIAFNMVSTSLLTPVAAKGEKDMLKAQTEAWNEINEIGKEGMKIMVNGKEYNVKPNVLTFNYGVNEGAVSHPKIKLEFVHGWGASGKLNNASLQELLTRAWNFIQTCKDGKIKNAVMGLRDQIAAIRDGHLERKDEHEAYKMASRIAVMSYLMGDVPVWNCKSGKDRTGWMDVECKFFATLIEMDKPIPWPGDPLTASQKKLFNTLLLQSGNHEMQAYNTGVAGFKLEHVASIEERADIKGDNEAQKTFMGASKYAGS